MGFLYDMTESWDWALYYPNATFLLLGSACYSLAACNEAADFDAGDNSAFAVEVGAGGERAGCSGCGGGCGGGRLFGVEVCVCGGGRLFTMEAGSGGGRLFGGGRQGRQGWWAAAVFMGGGACGGQGGLRGLGGARGVAGLGGQGG